MAKRNHTIRGDEDLKPELLAPEGDLTGSSPTDLDRLRDILFGQQARTSSQRFAALEHQLAALRQELDVRIGSQAESVNAQGLNLTQRLDELTANVAQLRQEAAQSNERLRQELLGVIAALDERKASRQNLGQMLVELGQRLQAG